MTDRSGREMKGKGEEAGKLEGLPLNSSPYTQYKDLEEYKQQGYGTQGHIQPKPGRGAAASVDAPTQAAGETIPPTAQLSSTNVINRQGVP